MQPAWYVLPSTSWPARWFNTIHWPYTLWHLAYVVIGAALAPSIDFSVLGWLLVAFFFGMGIGAHAFDLISEDPLKLGLRDVRLLQVGLISLLIAVVIGIYLVSSDQVSAWFYIPVGLGGPFAIGYGRSVKYIHSDVGFALWWAVFPTVTAYISMGIEWSWALIPILLFVYATAHTQRVLSTRVRFIRRRMACLPGESNAKRKVEIGGKEWLVAADEQALAALSFTLPVLAIALVVWR